MRNAIREVLRSPWNRVGIVSVAALLVLLLVIVVMEYLA